MTQNNLYELAYHSLGLCLREGKRDIAIQDFRDAWKRLLSHYAQQNGLITPPTTAEDVTRKHNFVLEHFGEIEPMFNQRDLYNLIIAAEHVGRQDESSRLKAVLKRQEPSLDVETSIGVWKKMAYSNSGIGRTPREIDYSPIIPFQIALNKAKKHDYDGAIGELEKVTSGNPNIRAEKEFFLGTLYLMKWQSGFSDVFAMSKARRHFENEVKFRGSYSRQGLESIAIIGSFEGGFMPNIKSR